jgi:hypothetical protein
MLIEQPIVGRRQRFHSGLVRRREFGAPVGPQTLQPLKSPNLGLGLNAEEWNDIFSVSPGDNDYSCLAETNDLLQDLRNARIRKGLLRILLDRC